MNWHYVSAGQSVGPISEADFDQLVLTGTIRPDTMVWNETMANWQPLSTARPGTLTAIPPVGPVGLTGQTGVGAAPSGTEQVICAECRQSFPASEAVNFGNAWVCAACKPVYFQKLKEGAALPVLSTELPYAGFWIRLGAKMIDGLALGVVLIIPVVIFLLFYFVPRNPRGANAVSLANSFGLSFQLSIQFGSILLKLLYNWFFLSKYGATLGKMACGLKVVSATGAPLSSGQALGRSAAEILSGVICYIGYIIAAFDDQKRALHDHIAGTRVVKK